MKKPLVIDLQRLFYLNIYRFPSELITYANRKIQILTIYVVHDIDKPELTVKPCDNLAKLRGNTDTKTYIATFQQTVVTKGIDFQAPFAQIYFGITRDTASK